MSAARWYADELPATAAGGNTDAVSGRSADGVSLNGPDITASDAPRAVRRSTRRTRNPAPVHSVSATSKDHVPVDFTRVAAVRWIEAQTKNDTDLPRLAGSEFICMNAVDSASGSAGKCNGHGGAVAPLGRTRRRGADRSAHIRQLKQLYWK